MSENGRDGSKTPGEASLAKGFDEQFYILHNPDVAVAVSNGQFASGLHHFDLYGRLENRANRHFTSWPDIVTDHAEVVRPEHNHFSGLTIGLLRRFGHGDTLRVEISRNGCERVARIDLATVENFREFHIYWEPIADSQGEMFVVTAQLEGTPPGVALIPFRIVRDAKALVYSAPEADSAFPPGILFSPVTQCNLNCIHCVSRETRKTLSVMTEAAWQEIAEAARAGELHHVQTDYSGDIFFNEERHGGWLSKLIELGIPFIVDTHGNTLTEKHVEALLSSRLLRINFSIDTLDPGDYQKIRKGGRQLTEVIDNIRAFMTARNARRPDIEAIFSLVLMQRNLTSIGKALEVAADLGMSGVSTSYLHAHTPDMADQSVMLDREGLASGYAALQEKAKKLCVGLWLPPLPVSSVPRRGHRPCTYPWESAVVLGNGDVMACNVPGTKVGNTRNSSLREVWNGPAFREFRRRINSDNPPDSCTVCPMLSYPNNFASHVAGLTEAHRTVFEQRCAANPREDAT